MSDIQRNQHWAELDLDVPLHHHSLYRKIDTLLADREPGKVLEVGCLDGRYLEHLKARGWDVAGIDIQPQDREYILEHDASEPLPFSEEFDVVVAAEVIEHIVDSEQFLENLSSALRPGGSLILTTPNLLFVVNRVRMLFGAKPLFAYADFHVRMFVYSDLEDKVGKKFKIERVLGSHVLVGRRRGRWAEPFSRIADIAPKLAAHFIIESRKLG